MEIQFVLKRNNAFGIRREVDVGDDCIGTILQCRFNDPTERDAAIIALQMRDRYAFYSPVHFMFGDRQPD